MRKYLLPLAFALSALPLASAQAIVGGWVFGDASQPNSSAVFTFLGNGTFYFAQDGDSSPSGDPTGHDGMERGTYTWNATTGALTATTVGGTDTNGQWGIAAPNDGSGNTHAFVTGNTLTLGDSPNTFDLSRVTSLTNSLVGSWVSADQLTALTFLDNGYYFDVEDGSSDSTGGPGIERGTFNFTGGSLSTVAILDTNGNWGFGTNSISASLIGDTLTLDGSLELTRVGASAIPEPSTYAALAGLAALGVAIYRRRKASVD